MADSVVALFGNTTLLSTLFLPFSTPLTSPRCQIQLRGCWIWYEEDTCRPVSRRMGRARAAAWAPKP
uniref:Uncharacterized protein n=1 Tax=Oryza rufipogon TaxID=4529 RepID=A0A0E0QH67_ORYRU